MTRKAIVVISFGTSHSQAREKTIGKLEADFRSRFPDYQVRRACSSRLIVKILKERDGISIDTEEEAVNRLLHEGFTDLILQPIYMVQGLEYEKIVSVAKRYEHRFHSLNLGAPLLTHPEDYEKTAQTLLRESWAHEKKDTAIVYMGHGSGNWADRSYGLLQEALRNRGAWNHIIAMMEGMPDLDAVLSQLKHQSIHKVILTPLMIVAGEHILQNMAGNKEDSWNTILKSKGYETECVLRGLGELEGIREIFNHHLERTINRHILCS